jgi:SAM-dependent methyltransferase
MAEVLERIQRECLRAYPKEVLAKMASGTKEVPEAVDHDPKAQMQFLDKELDVEKGLFYPSLLEELLPPFERALGEGTRFLDLGSGDGRVIFLANVLGAHATGMEYDPAMIQTTVRAQEALGDLLDGERIELIEGDFFKSTWSGYDVIFYFDISSSEHQRVRTKLLQEMGPDTRLVVAYEIYPFEGFDLEAEFGPMKVFRIGKVPSAETGRDAEGTVDGASNAPIQ